MNVCLVDEQSMMKDLLAIAINKLKNSAKFALICNVNKIPEISNYFWVTKQLDFIPHGIKGDGNMHIHPAYITDDYREEGIQHHYKTAIFIGDAFNPEAIQIFDNVICIENIDDYNALKQTRHLGIGNIKYFKKEAGKWAQIE